MYVKFNLVAYFAAIAIIPITASFSTYIGHEFIGFCYFLSAVYFLDVIINLFTVREKNIIATVDESRITYLKSRFIFDAVSMIPWFSIAYLYNIKFSEEFSVIYMIRIYNLYKILMENAIYKKIANKLDEKYGLGSSFFSMFGMGSLLFVFLHLHACSYFLVGKMIEFSSTSWISLNNSTDILSKSLSDQYSWAFFAAIGNTFPVTGYRPSSVVEKWITIFLILIGATLYAVLVGTISSFSFGLDSSGRLYNEKIEEVQEYLNFKQLDDKIKTRVKKYYELKYNGKYFDEKQIMSELNISLRQEIAVHICRKLIEKVPFLNRKTGDGRDESFARSISTALEPVYFIDGDRIFEQGEVYTY